MKKGFTLVEILATLVILSIVGVIASYIVLNVLEDSKNKNRVMMASKVASTMESYALNYELNNGTTFVNQTIPISNKNVQGLDFALNGTLTDEGLISIDENGLITVYLYDGKYCTYGTKDNLTSVLGECDYSGNYTLTFSISTSLSIDKQTITISTTDIISSHDLNVTPYSFDGGSTWQAGSSYSTTNSFQNNVCVRNINNKSTCNSFAIYKLNINANGGILTNMDDEDLFWLKPSDTSIISSPTKIGNTFSGWTVGGAGSSISGTTFTMGSANATLTANWTINTYTLTVNANGGSWSGTTPQNINYGSTTTIANPTRTGYTFTGWTLSGTGSSINGTTFTMGSANATLTANWTINTYTLTVNANGGSWSGTTPQNINYGSTTTIANPTRTGYTFNNWTVSGAGSTISGTTFTMGTTNATLTANWTINTYTLTVNANGGSWSGTTPQALTMGNTSVIAKPSRSGYVFTGWSVGGTGSSMSGNIFTMGSANAALTANWLSYSSMYTYTGSSSVIDDGSGNWRIKFLTSGNFTPLVSMTIDVFLVGGGGGGSQGGGGGGYTATYSTINLIANTSYSIIIGAGGAPSTYGTSGGTTSAFSYSVSGAVGGYADTRTGGNGGSGGGGGHRTETGGNGGSNGGNGVNSYGAGGIGQGTTTREFGEASGTLYSGGGGGASYQTVAPRPGGAGGGGQGAGNASATSGQANTGGGGGGGLGNAYGAGAAGGSGIVVIRNHR